MSIVRFDPFREMAQMQDRINRIFGDAYTRRHDDDLTQRGDWMPPVDVYESADQQVVLKAELPGVSREDIDLRVENNTLTLRGERRRDSEVKDEQFHRVERSYGAFSRSFALPSRIDAEPGPRRLQGRRAHDHAADQGRSQAAADRGRGRLNPRRTSPTPTSRGLRLAAYASRPTPCGQVRRAAGEPGGPGARLSAAGGTWP